MLEKENVRRVLFPIESLLEPFSYSLYFFSELFGVLNKYVLKRSREGDQNIPVMTMGVFLKLTYFFASSMTAMNMNLWSIPKEQRTLRDLLVLYSSYFSIVLLSVATSFAADYFAEENFYILKSLGLTYRTRDLSLLLLSVAVLLVPLSRFNFLDLYERKVNLSLLRLIEGLGLSMSLGITIIQTIIGKSYDPVDHILIKLIIDFSIAATILLLTTARSIYSKYPLRNNSDENKHSLKDCLKNINDGFRRNTIMFMRISFNTLLFYGTFLNLEERKLMDLLSAFGLLSISFLEGDIFLNLPLVQGLLDYASREKELELIRDRGRVFSRNPFFIITRILFLSAAVYEFQRYPSSFGFLRVFFFFFLIVWYNVSFFLLLSFKSKNSRGLFNGFSTLLKALTAYFMMMFIATTAFLMHFVPLALVLIPLLLIYTYEEEVTEKENHQKPFRYLFLTLKLLI